MSTFGITWVMLGLGLLFTTKQFVFGSFVPINHKRENTDSNLEGSSSPESTSFQMSTMESEMVNRIGLNILEESGFSGSGSDEPLDHSLQEETNNIRTLDEKHHLDVADEYRTLHLPDAADELNMSDNVPDEDISDELIFQKCGTPNICTHFKSYCPDDKMCRFNLDECLPKCICYPDDAGCNHSFNTKTNQHFKTSVLPTQPGIRNMKSAISKKDSGPIGCVETRQIPEERCHSSLPCYNGYCVRSPLTGGQGIEVYCACSVSWQGRSCDVCCPLQCNNGSCQVEPSTGGMFCTCQFGHQGERCEEKVELLDVALGKKNKETPVFSHLFVLSIYLNIFYFRFYFFISFYPFF